MKSLGGTPNVVLSVLFVALLLPASAPAQDTSILESATVIPRIYLIQLSGTVQNEKFSGAQALLTVARPTGASTNPYLVTIIGFPKKNSENTLAWNSFYTDMYAVSNQITCKIKHTALQKPGIHFFYFSQEVQSPKGILSFRDREEVERTKEVALPTKVIAQAGELKLKAKSSSVSGSVWIKGFDSVARSYSTYNARFFGRKTLKLEPKQEQKRE